MENVSSSNGLKDSSVLAPTLRFPEFKEEWKTDNLGNIGTFTKGAALSKADISDDGTPFILYGELYTTYSEVTYDIKRKTDKQVSDVHYSKIGDVIIPTSGETPEEIATATCVMIPNVILAGDLNIYRTNKVDGRIISFIINHKVNDKISKVAQGKSVVHIKADEIGKISINYPDYVEQQKIASFLEIIDQRIAKQRELIENLKSYKRGVLKRLFVNNLATASKVRLGDIATFFSGGTPKVSISEYYNGDIPFIRSGEIHNSKTEITITSKGLESSAAKMVSKGDLLYALYGATSGEVAISQMNGAINQAILCIRSKEINIAFLAYWLEFSKNDIISRLLQGGQGNLSSELVKGFNVPNADRIIQDKYVALLQHIDNYIASNQEVLDEVIHIKEYLNHHLFI